jgi:signal transduction histidine kinase/Flp pilus assembly protein TadD
MKIRFLWLPGITLFLMNSVMLGIPIDDKSMDKPILASEKKKVEGLIARASYLGSVKSDSCVVFAKEALHLARAYNSPVHEVKALDVLGNYYYDIEEYHEALDFFRQLLTKYTQVGDSASKASCYNIVGLAYYNLGIYNEAVRAYHQAVRLAISQNDTLLMAKCNQNIGVLYDEIGRSEEAMNYYQKSLDLNRLLKNRVDEAGVLQNIGIIHYKSKRYKEALGYYLSALKIYDALSDSASSGLMYLNLGTLYEDQAEYKRSLGYYEKSLVVFLKEDYKLGLAYSYYSLASIGFKTGDYEQALVNVNKSLAYSEMISLVENESDCHKLMADIYAALGDYRSAFEEMNEYEVLHDSLYNENVQEQIAEMELRYKTQLKDTEIANLKNEREEAERDMIRRTITLTSIVTLTLIIIIVSVYYSRTMKKANKRLTLEVDERIRAEKELLNIKESLEERVNVRTHELERAKSKAEESERLKTAFIANMSHEIRTPLNAITGFSGLLLREDIPAEKRKEYNDQIMKNNKILVNMIEDLIDTSKIESGTLQLHPSPIQIAHLMSQLNEPLFENMAKKNKPFLEIIQDKLELKSPTIVADPVRLKQVIWNLLDNAVKFTIQGSIRYGCYETNQHVIFYVDDTGIGIPDEYKEVIFEKFRQLDESAKRKYGGTGLGLYYAQKIAGIMGGRIWFEQKKENGSIFYFSLPKVEQHQPAVKQTMNNA